MRNPWGMRAVLVATIAIPSSALAQQKIPDDRAIDLQTFEYAIGPKTFFTVGDADVAAPKQLAIDALLTYLTKPFTVFNVTSPGMVGSERTVVVQSIAAAQLTGAYGINDKLQLGINLPIILQLSGDGLDAMKGTASCAMPPCLTATGLGDALVEGKYRLYRQGKWRAAGAVGVTLPTSLGSDFQGDDLPTLRGTFSVQFDPNSQFSLGGNAGFIVRKPHEIYNSTIGPQFTWGLAAAFRVTQRFSVIGESYGRAGLPDFSLDSSPLEAEGGLRVYVTGSIAVVVGGGAGLVKGIGSPQARFFGSVSYAPDVRDTDGDGIPNSRDKCPTVPEDKDGFQDADGCPDDDNDNDGVRDADDKCPNQAEDIDGFQDEDGCPDPDNDNDGIPDLQDKCPNDPEDHKEPNPNDGCPLSKRDSDGDGIMDDVDQCPLEEEDKDGFEDADGCPDPDNDHDGIPDAQDKCPVCPEDKDGFQDADGCPDLDNDKDGIPDSVDKCPNEPETVNGIQDADGCPDKGGVTLVKLDGDKLIMDKVPALAGKALSYSGGQQVDQVALILKAHDEVTKWLIALAQPKLENAKLLADLVKARLVAKGVPEDHLQVVGAEGNPKIAGVVQERAETAAPFVCPANLEVKPRTFVKPVAQVSKKPDGEIQMDGDRDGDDFPDSVDKCPDQPETINGYEDDDGCPDTVPEPLKKFAGTIAGVNFKSGSAELLPTSLKILDDAAKTFTSFPALHVEIQGHTDDEALPKNGKFADNTALSQARAEAVKTYLASKGIAADRMTAKGFGDTKPAVPFKDLKGAPLQAARVRNRRVEFKLVDKPPPKPGATLK